MPRRKARESEARVETVAHVQWRFLLRHPDFRNDLQELARVGQIDLKNFLDESERVTKKWGLIRIPPLALSYAHWLADRTEVEFFEPFGRDRFGISYTPVMLAELKENRFLFLRIDVEQPLEQLLPLIERELRSFYRERPQRRSRFDKIDFQLKVYDLAVNGKKLTEIAEELKKRLSTVKSGFLAAKQRIYGAIQSPTKNAVVHAYLDPKKHAETCRQCKTATRLSEMCDAALSYVQQGEKKQLRETLGHDTSDSAHRKGR